MSRGDRSKPGHRDIFMEYPWMGSGLTPAQRNLIQKMTDALNHYAQGPDPGMAEHALRVEGARRPQHAAVGGRAPMMPCDLCGAGVVPGEDPHRCVP